MDIEAIANLTTKNGRYIGIVSGRLKNNSSNFSNIRYEEKVFTDIDGNQEEANLDDILEFPYGDIKRDVSKFIEYVFSFDINGRTLINLDFNRFSETTLIRNLNYIKKKKNKIIGVNKSFIGNIFEHFFGNGDIAEMRNEIMSNIARLDDRRFLEELNTGQTTIIGAYPIERQRNINYDGIIRSSDYYFIIKKDKHELRCEIPNLKKRHNLVILAVDRAIETKKEIIVGGNYFHKDNKIVVHYIRTDKMKYPLFSGLFHENIVKARK